MDGRRYLLVDDNRALVENLAEILVDAGATVDIAFSGAEALEQAAHERYDVLMTDMRMPVMNGAELIQQIRIVDPDLPVIIVTAHTSDEDLNAALREGLLAVLPKPTPIAQLAKLLDGARRGGLVALVEDDVVQCGLLAEALRARGFSTVTATSIAEIEDHLGSVAPVVALVDMHLPGGPPGIGLARIRDRFPSVPLIVVTGHPTSVPRGCCAEVFKKPFSAPALVDAIERIYLARPFAKA